MSDTTSMHGSIALIGLILGANILRINLPNPNLDDNIYYLKYITYVLILALSIMMAVAYTNNVNVGAGLVIGVLTALLFYYGVVYPTSGGFV